MDHNDFVQIDLIFQRKLSRGRLPITFVNFVSHASAQALQSITFTQRCRTTRRPFKEKKLKKTFFRLEVERSALSESGTLALHPRLAFFSLFLGDYKTFLRFVDHSPLDSDIEP